MVVRAVGLFTVLVSVLLFVRQADAQINITFPVSRLVVQRNNANQATVQIAGSYGQSLDAVEARVVVRTVGQGTTTPWTTIQTNPVNGQFNGTLAVQGGWYQLEVRGISGGVAVATSTVDRFGVGEVFAIMGHSNAQGSSCTVNGQDQCPSTAGPSDDRVTVVGVDQNTSSYQNNYLNTADTRYLPGLLFSKLTNGSGMSPFASLSWLWGPMGDSLVKRINVPVLIYNAGFGGSNMQQTYYAAYDIPFQHSFIKYSIRMPYANVRNLMNLYVPTTGLRAILVQHGENDRGNPADSTEKYYRKVFDQIRTEFNKPNLAYIVAISSYVGAQFSNVRTPQFNVVNTPNYKAYLGPDLDNISALGDRPDGIHFSPSGQVKAGNAWATAITNQYLTTISPYLAETQPLAAIACAPGNQLLLTQPTGYQYEWNDGSTVNSLTVGTGTYSARLRNPQNKILFPPPVVVPASIRPATPTISTPSGSLSICQSTGLQLTSSYTGPNQWSTGETSPTISATAAGAYSVQAANPAYGCLSGTTSQTINRAAADLALSLQTSRRTVTLNDTVSIWFRVQNKGGCDAGQLDVQSRLPPNVSFVSSADNLANNNNLVSGTIANVLVGTSISKRYVARLTAAGTYFASAELTASASPLLNATLNNGTANGEADEAQTDLRTTISSSAVYTSPNPNQIALPPVQSNQPTPDPAKADLSLQIQASSQATKPGNPVSITLTVANRGGLTATNIVLNNTLPAGLQFVSSPSGMTVNGTTVSGTIAQIQAGQSGTLIFVAQATGNGTFINKAQIATANQPDPDSTPGNGYTNGEDDEASVYLRASQ